MDRKLAFGLRLKAIRQARRMSQERFAELLERSTEAVSNMERGINLPSLETLIRLSEKLEIPLRDLCEAFDPTDDDPKRAELQAALVEHARRISTRDLEIAVKQIQVVPKER